MFPSFFPPPPPPPPPPTPFPLQRSFHSKLHNYFSLVLSAVLDNNSNNVRKGHTENTAKCCLPNSCLHTLITTKSVPCCSCPESKLGRLENGQRHTITTVMLSVWFPTEQSHCPIEKVRAKGQRACRNRNEQESSLYFQTTQEHC